ncbi:unnamed protein product [Allacma fusca]|uniref:Uncharacterized protein n=1 Tax=Allacma fusca TaxID=39272 RepID=A0A8J2L806_9HEXA|nr:unnamed protein product [Allacma fusca]
MFKKELRSGTSNLLKHLRYAHENKLPKNSGGKAEDAKGSLPEAFKNVIRKCSDEELHRLIVEFIIMTDQPFSIVEADSFEKLIEFLAQKSIKIPRRDSVKRKIETMFEREKANVAELIKNAPEKIFIVVDCWTSRTGKSFHGILATFIDADWKYQQLVLDFDILQGRHKGKKLAESIFKVLNEFGITSKLLAVTCDNASNMNTMVEELARLLKAEKIDLKPEDRRVRCLAHIINLACQSAISVLKQIEPADVPQGYSQVLDSSESEDDMSDAKSPTPGGKKKYSIYSRLKQAIVKIRKSNNLRDSMSHFCDTMGVPKLQLIKDMVVRWNSTLKMLKRCLELQKA